MTRDDAGRGTTRRLLVLTDDLGGGTGNHLLSLTEIFASGGWEVEVVSFAPRTARRNPGIRITRLPEPPGVSSYPFRQIARFRQVRDVVRDRSPDLVHAFFFWPILHARILRGRGSIPLLVENREDVGFNWGLHEYFWLRLTRRIPDRVVCVSQAVRNAVLEKERMDPGRTLVIHNGVERCDATSRTRVRAVRRELGIPPEAPVVGMVANLNRSVKGMDRFLDVVPLIRRVVPDVHVVIVGGGASEEHLRVAAAEKDLGEWVHFTGYREDVHLFYDLMDVSVLSSRTEGLSITLLESMSHGLPVVATRVGGNPEVVIDGETGFLVPVDDPSLFARRVARLLGDGRLRLQMGAAARRRVEEWFRIDRAAEAYLNVYRNLADQRPAR